MLPLLFLPYTLLLLLLNASLTKRDGLSPGEKYSLGLNATPSQYSVYTTTQETRIIDLFNIVKQSQNMTFKLEHNTAGVSLRDQITST
jgi:hypothetical protein